MTQCIVVVVAGRAKAWQLRLSRSRGDQVIYSSPIESSCCCLLHFSSRKSLALGGVSRICYGQVSKNISIFISISFDFNFYCNTYAMRWFIRWRSCAAVFLCLRSIRNKSKNQKKLQEKTQKCLSCCTRKSWRSYERLTTCYLTISLSVGSGGSWNKETENGHCINIGTKGP